MNRQSGPGTDPTARERSIDGLRRVSGGTAFVNDVRCEGALHVAFTLSSHEHAAIRGVDLSPALAVDGVVAAIAGADLGPMRLGRVVQDYPVLAVDRVLFVGQRVAAVAAIDRETARRAADLVEVDYEPLPPVRDRQAALADGAPVLHPDYASYAGGLADRSHPNVQGLWELARGDADGAFAECDELHENTFSVPRSHSASLEPHACLVVPVSDAVHVYSTHKAPYELRRDLARLSGRPEHDFTVHPAHIGGDFGSKGFPYVEAACYFLAVRSGRPVRCVLSFYEELTATGARHPSEFRLRTGLRGGQMHAHESDVVLDGGAFAALKAHWLAVVPAIRAPVELYEVPNVSERCESTYSNSLPGAHVRSPGEFQAAFAGESHIDLMARARGEDPIEFRLRHTTAAPLRRVIETLRDRVAGWRAEQAGERDTGIGVALCFRDSGPGSTTASCRARRDGAIVVELAVPDQGAGSYTLFRRLAARELGVPEDAVAVKAAATDRALVDSGAGASRVSSVAGRATVQACQALVAELGGAPTTDGEGGAHWIARRLHDLDRDEVEVTGSWTMSWPPAPGADIRSYAAVAIEVAVDRDTGQFDIRRALVVADTGVVVNPVAHRGQVEGGFVYGLSQATLEELVVEEGQVVTASLGDYRLVSAADVPPLETVVIESDEDAFSGMRSVGELTNVGAAPALANAIHDAVGVRLRQLPITPERILRACASTAEAVPA